MLVEVFLEFLICIVNVKLLKTIHLCLWKEKPILISQVFGLGKKKPFPWGPHGRAQQRQQNCSRVGHGTAFALQQLVSAQVCIGPLKAQNEVRHRKNTSVWWACMAKFNAHVHLITHHIIYYGEPRSPSEMPLAGHPISPQYWNYPWQPLPCCSPNFSYHPSIFSACFEAIFSPCSPKLISDLEILKPEDIQDSHRLKVLLPFYLYINLASDPGEALWIKGHGERVPGVSSLGTNREEDVGLDTPVNCDVTVMTSALWQLITCPGC